MNECKNEECVLVEFVNESKSYAVGFREWLFDEELIQDKAKLQLAITSKTETSIKWPINCDVLSAKKKIDCDYKKHIILIYGFGEWTCMHEKMDSMMKFGDPDPKKANRKLHAKRNLSPGEKMQCKPIQVEKKKKAGPPATKACSSKESAIRQRTKQQNILTEYLELKAKHPLPSDTNSSDEGNRPKKSLTKEKSKGIHSSDDEKQQKPNQVAKRKKAGPPATKVSSKGSTIRQAKQKALLTDYRSHKAKESIEIDSESSDEENRHLTKQELINKLRLVRYDKKKLKQRLQIYESDFPAFMKMSSEIHNNLQQALKKAETVSQELDHSKDEINNYNRYWKDTLQSVNKNDKEKHRKEDKHVEENKTDRLSKSKTYPEETVDFIRKSKEAAKIHSESTTVTKKTESVKKTDVVINQPIVISNRRVSIKDIQKDSEGNNQTKKGQDILQEIDQDHVQDEFEKKELTNYEDTFEGKYQDHKLEIEEINQKSYDEVFKENDQEQKQGTLDINEQKDMPEDEQTNEHDSDQQQEEHHYNGQNRKQAIEDKIDDEEEMIELTHGVRIEKTRLLSCNHETFRTLSNSIVGALFSMEELATSSLSGSAANFDKSKSAKKKNLIPRGFLLVSITLSRNFQISLKLRKLSKHWLNESVTTLRQTRKCP